MISNLIKVSVVAAALALGGSAVANNNGGTQSTQQQTQQQVQPQQGQQTQQQGMNDNIKSVRLNALDQQQIRDLQTRLQTFGFYQGKIDGVLGQNTRSALVS